MKNSPDNQLHLEKRLGIDESVNPGIYECLICDRKFILKDERNKLEACSNCQGIDFRVVEVKNKTD
jgi:DNA-directed RNA polymerase subunit RPC12/RpoP